MTSVRCPQCGAENTLLSGARLMHCAFCDAALYVDRAGLVSHYRLPRLLDAEAAGAALRRWMAGNQTVKDLDRKATLVTIEPLSFPMWLFRLNAAGGETTVVEPAAPTPVPQLADLAVPAGKLEPYREEAGVETVAAAVPLETARGWLVQRASSDSGSREPTETALVHVPLWRAEYGYGGKSFAALIDGSTGAVLASVFPAKAETPYRVVAGLGLALFLVEGLLIANPFYKLAAYALTALPLFGLAYLVARKV